MNRAAQRPLSRKEHRVPQYLGIDKKCFTKRHRYETLICDFSKGTLECVIEDRRQESLETYLPGRQTGFRQFSEEELKKIKAIVMDMWAPYIATSMVFVPDAEDKIVSDRFYVMQQVTGAVDKVRHQENKTLMAERDDGVKGAKHL